MTNWQTTFFIALLGAQVFVGLGCSDSRPDKDEVVYRFLLMIEAKNPQARVESLRVLDKSLLEWVDHEQMLHEALSPEQRRAVLSTLIRCLSDENQNICLAALDPLEVFNDEVHEVIPAVRKLLKSPDARVSLASACWLFNASCDEMSGTAALPEARDVLLKNLHSDEPSHRATALEFLPEPHRMGLLDDRAIKEIARVAETDPDKSVREAAVRTLGHIERD